MTPSARLVAQALIHNPSLRGVAVRELSKRLNVPILPTLEGVSALVRFAKVIGLHGLPQAQLDTIHSDPQLERKIAPTMSFDEALYTFGSVANGPVYTPYPIRSTGSWLDDAKKAIPSNPGEPDYKVDPDLDKKAAPCDVIHHVPNTWQPPASEPGGWFDLTPTIDLPIGDASTRMGRNQWRPQNLFPFIHIVPRNDLPKDAYAPVKIAELAIQDAAAYKDTINPINPHLAPEWCEQVGDTINIPWSFAQFLLADYPSFPIFMDPGLRGKTPPVPGPTPSKPEKKDVPWLVLGAGGLFALWLVFGRKKGGG